VEEEVEDQDQTLELQVAQVLLEVQEAVAEVLHLLQLHKA
tara:strand:+ start:244 stop:363 length:120 start_codon:yes stop_codon:yes gene_type:complete